MRWLVFILFILPSSAMADKATRDKLLVLIEEVGACGEILNLHITEPDRFQKSQLIMKYEIDEQIFTMANIKRMYENFLTMTAVKAGPLFASLDEQEKKYVQIKAKEFEKGTQEFALTLLDDPKKLAKNIRKCMLDFVLF